MAGSLAQDVSHYLLLGFDFWGDETIGTSFNDTNIIMSIDTAHNRILVSSIMRDSYVTMPDGRQSKLNQVVRKSDMDTVVKTVEDMMNIDLAGYVAISAPGFARLIGELGGVEVDISYEEYFPGLQNNPNIPGVGKHVLRGNGLLAYIRNRKLEGHDRGRTERAREVMGKLMEKAKAMSAMELMGFATKAMKEVQTDMSLMDMVKLATKVLGLNGIKMDGYVIPADNTWKYGEVHGNSIVDVDWEANSRLFAEFVAGN